MAARTFVIEENMDFINHILLDLIKLTSFDAEIGASKKKSHN